MNREWIPKNPYPYKHMINKSVATNYQGLSDGWEAGSIDTLKTMIDWLEGNCPHYIKKYDGEPETMPRRMCTECMQDLG